VSAGVRSQYGAPLGFAAQLYEAEQALRAGERLFGPDRPWPLVILALHRPPSHSMVRRRWNCFSKRCSASWMDYDEKTGEPPLLETLE